MLKKSVQPSTIDGIKRSAKKIKKAEGISHSQALNRAAQSASFMNFAHARRQLAGTLSSGPTHHQLFMTAYWYDRENGRSGRETLELKLLRSLSQIASKSELKSARGLGWFRQAAPDHLVMDELGQSQQSVRNIICKAARTLRFMEGTRLKPSKDFEAAYPDRDYENRLPQSDHATDWFEPETGQFILIDEPYSAAIVAAERSSWAVKHNWHLQASKWPSIHNPYNCSLFVATDASTDFNFQELMSRIDSLPEPVTEEKWIGVSVESDETFVSPLAITSQDRKRAKAKGTIWRVPTDKTVPMSHFSVIDDRRPKAVMQIPSHELLARQIKAILQSKHKPWTVNTRLNTIRSELENWFFAERDRKETDEYGLFYYGNIAENDPFVLKLKSPNSVIEMLREIKGTLESSYNDCAPLRKLIKKLDTSIRLTQKFNDKIK